MCFWSNIDCVCVIMFQHKSILRRLSFKSVFLSKYTFCHFYTEWYIKTSTLKTYCVMANSSKGHFSDYLYCDSKLMIICSKKNKLYLNLKSIIFKPSYFPWYDHNYAYYTPWIKQYCYICSCPFSTNLVILVQVTIDSYYMCKVWKLSDV